MSTTSVPLDTWVVVEPLDNELKPTCTQQEAGHEHDMRNAQLGNRLYSACGFWRRLRVGWAAPYACRGNASDRPSRTARAASMHHAINSKAEGRASLVRRRRH
jgi:hypothetical protein